MNQPPSPRADRRTHGELIEGPGDRALLRLWRSDDPVPPEVDDAAKAAFGRRRPTTTEPPVVLDLRAPRRASDRRTPKGTEHREFGNDESPVHIEIESEIVDRVVTLRCAVRAARLRPCVVTAETTEGDHPLSELARGRYGVTGIPAGPLRLSVEFTDRPDRSVVTSWFTA